MLGNKEDLVSKREVSDDEATQYAESIGGFFLVTSAKTKNGVEAAFQAIARRSLMQIFEA